MNILKESREFLAEEPYSARKRYLSKFGTLTHPPHEVIVDIEQKFIELLEEIDEQIVEIKGGVKQASGLRTVINYRLNRILQNWNSSQSWKIQT